MKILEIPEISKIKEVAEIFLKPIEKPCIIAFYGEMGVGKTTFIQALCKVLGVVEPVSSPTFSIVNEYRCGIDCTVYHFDFYRINIIDEVFDFGYEEYFSENAYIFIEWPELIEELLPQDTVKVNITLKNEDLRQISFAENL
jgi:tRNA threonylcarbamoyladenosine biosynthesis protein TsaE